MEMTEEDAWEDFKSTPEPMAVAEAPVPVGSNDKASPVDAGEGSSGADPLPPFGDLDNHQLKATDEHPTAAVGEEGRQDDAGVQEADGLVLPHPSPTAEGAVESTQPRIMAPVMMGDLLGAPAETLPLPPQQQGDVAAVDLLGMVPSPTAAAAAAGAASGGDVVGDGGDGNIDFFGSMLLSSSLKSGDAEEITAAAVDDDAATSDAAVAPGPLQHGEDGGSDNNLEADAGNEKADDEKVEGGWGLLEQPEPATTTAAVTGTAGPANASAVTPPATAAATPLELDFSWRGAEESAGDIPSTETTSPPAEKVDGEWIDLIATPGSIPQESDNKHDDGGDNSTDGGAGDTPATSDEGTAAVERDEEEEPRLSESDTESKCISPTAAVLVGGNDAPSPGHGDNDTGKEEPISLAAAFSEDAIACPVDAARGELLAMPAGAPELRISEAESSDLLAGGGGANEDKSLCDSSKRPVEDAQEMVQDGGPLEPGAAVFPPLQEAGNEPGEENEAVGTAAIAEGEAESTPTPDVADLLVPAVPAEPEQVSDVDARGTNATVAAAADVFDWEDFDGATGGTAGVEAETTATVVAPSGGLGGSAGTEQQENGNDGDKAADDSEQGEEEDEWSAFEAPPTPPAAETPQEALSTSRELGQGGVSVADATPLATQPALQERGSDDGLPEPVPAAPVPAATADELDQSERSDLPDDAPGADDTAGDSQGESGEAAVASTSPASGDAWGSFGQAEASSASPSGGTAELAGGEWGAFGQAEASSADLPSEEAEPARSNDGGASPDDRGLASDGEVPMDHDDDEEEKSPPAIPELGGADGRKFSSSSWGAFDEAPVAVEAVTTTPVEAATAAESGNVAEEAEELSTKSQESSAASAAAELSTDAAERAEGSGELGAGTAAAVAVGRPQEGESTTVHAVGDGAGAAFKDAVAKPALDVNAGAAEAETGAEVEDGGNGDAGAHQEQSSESEDDWGSDFGDFEEAPLPGPESEPPASAVGSPSTAAAGAASFAETGAIPKPPVSTVRSPPATTGSGKGGVAATMEGAVSEPMAVSTMSVASISAAVAGGESPSLLAVMVAVFDMAFGNGGSAAVSRKARSAPGGSESAQEGSLDSLVDLANLLRQAQPPRRCRNPAGLNEWATRCILRGIRPVPDALLRGDADDEITALANASSRSGSSRSIGPHLPATVPAAVTTAMPPPPASSRVVPPSSAPRRAPTSPTARSAKTTSSRVVSPSRAPPPLRSPLKNTEKQPSAPQPHKLETGSDSAAGTKGIFAPEFKTDGAGVGAQKVAEVEKEPVFEARATAASETPSFASFPSVSSAELEPAARQKPPPPPPPPPPQGAVDDSEDDEFVWSEAVSEATTPEMPRQAPPRVPRTPAAAEDEEHKIVNGDDSEKGEGIRLDGTAPPPADGGDVAGAVVSNTAAEAGADDDGGDWSDDPFDSFQSAPAAAPLSSTPLASPALAPPPSTLPPAAAPEAVDRSATSPPQSSWNLDFLMAAPSTGGGRSSPSPEVEAGMAPAGGEGQSGKPLDLVSQALAGFGIDSPHGATDTTAHQEKNEDGGDFFSAFTGGTTSSNNAGGGFSSGGVKGERDRVSSVDVAGLLRATRLRGGARRGSRPREPLSAAAEARLAALPDLSYMLSQRICFPMRAALPIPAAAVTAATIGEALP